MRLQWSHRAWSNRKAKNVPKNVRTGEISLSLSFSRYFRFQAPSLLSPVSPAMSFSPSIFPPDWLPHPRKLDLGGIDTHRHCFAARYITLQNHTFPTPKTPPIYDLFRTSKQLPPPHPLFSLRSRITTSQLPNWLS